MLAISLPLNWGQGMLFFLAMGTILGAWGIIRVANSISSLMRAATGPRSGPIFPP